MLSSIRAERALSTLDILSLRSPVPASLARAARIIAIILIFTLTLGLSSGANPASAWQSEIPLDQALVLEGGESTNPRDYDPATTLSGGDKGVLSGLPSFDPQLNLTADLAARW